MALLRGSTAAWQPNIGWQLCGSRVVREQRVLRACRTFVQAGWWQWTLAESRQSYVRGVALSRETPKLQQVYESLLVKWHQYRALLPSCDTRCWRAELGVRHADWRREATAVIAKPASALLYDTALWYLVWVCGRVGVCFVVG